MIAVHILQKEEWERQLCELGCVRVFGRKTGALLSAEVWQTQEERWFTVPVEDGDIVGKWEFDRVLDNIKRLKPLDLDT